MCIGSPYAKRSHSGTAWQCRSRPCGELSVHIKGTVGKIYLRVRLFIMQAGRDHFMIECQARFEQSSHPCCGPQMSHIGFECSNGTEIFALSSGTKCLSKCSNLNGISQWGCRSMCLNIAKGCGINITYRHSL